MITVEQMPVLIPMPITKRGERRRWMRSGLLHGTIIERLPDG